MALHNRATLSIVGLYNWDDTIFEDMVLPNGIDKDEIIEDILFQCAELEIVYPDCGIMKQAIATWSKEELFKWNKIQKLAELEYNPIENYDRMETETINDSKATTAENTTVANSADTGKNKTTNSVTGYNTSAAVTDTVTDFESENKNSGISTGKGSTQETGNIIRNNRTHGNIGVTAPYQMILGDLSVYDSINLYQIIPVDFKLRFCIQVY